MNWESDNLMIELKSLEASFGKLIYMLTKYPTLNLTFSFQKIIKNIFLTQKHLQTNEITLDLRQVKELENEYLYLKKKVFDNQKNIVRMGNNLACELFLVQPLILKVLNLLKNVEKNETYVEYYTILSEYVFIAGRYVNQSLGIDEINY